MHLRRIVRRHLSTKLQPPVVESLSDEPLVEVVERVVPCVADRTQALPHKVFAQSHGFEAVLRVHWREVHLADQCGLVAGASELVRDGPKALAQSHAVLLSRQAVGMQTGQQ